VSVADVLYLVHRLPYPPNKGDKLRSYHLLAQLATHHRVHLGTFIDDAADDAHIPAVRALCATLHVERVAARAGPRAAALALACGLPISVAHYRSGGMAAWVRRTVREQAITNAVVFSAAMGQFITRLRTLRVLADFVDVDSDKWAQYARSRRWPTSALYRREATTLLAFEAALATRAVRSFFVTEPESALFRRLVPAVATRVETVENGVDAAYFDPALPHPSPFAADETPIVMTGAMDYWPNVDAATWFAANVLPALLKAWPSARFYVVGMRPAAAVRALAGSHVVVTGSVADVRPYLAHAAVAVAPLRIARGIQNKVLEAMAAGRAVVASSTCAAALRATPDRELLVAADAAGFVGAVGRLLRDGSLAARIGAAARAAVLARYDWRRNLARISECVDATTTLDADIADVHAAGVSRSSAAHGPATLREAP
jgi:sugar transferase (PEP-CTERM/EpsH1 system associated)